MHRTLQRNNYNKYFDYNKKLESKNICWICDTNNNYNLILQNSKKDILKRNVFNEIIKQHHTITDFNNLKNYLLIQINGLNLKVIEKNSLKKLKFLDLNKNEKVTNFNEKKNYFLLEINKKYFHLFGKYSLKKLLFENLKTHLKIKNIYENNNFFIFILTNNICKVFDKSTCKEILFLFDSKIKSISLCNKFLIIKYFNRKIITTSTSLEIVNIFDLKVNEYIIKFQNTDNFILLDTNNRNNLIFNKYSLDLIEIKEIKKSSRISKLIEHENYLSIELENKKIVIDKENLKSLNFYN